METLLILGSLVSMLIFASFIWLIVNILRRKPKKAALITLIISIALLFGLISLAPDDLYIANEAPAAEEQPAPEASLPGVILDVTAFYYGDTTVSESQLIEIKGEPDEVEEWNYKGRTLTYPIRTLYYGNFRFNFHNGILHRISADDLKISFQRNEDLLGMFGLRRHMNSSVTADTAFAYRVKNAGVYEFWVTLGDGNYISSVRISFSQLFEQ